MATQLKFTENSKTIQKKIIDIVEKLYKFEHLSLAEGGTVIARPLCQKYWNSAIIGMMTPSKNKKKWFKKNINVERILKKNTSLKY